MRLIAAVLFLFSLHASVFSKTDTRTDLICTVLGDSSVQLTSPNNKKLIVRLRDRNTCDTSYSFEANKDGSCGGVVAAGATEIDLNSTESV
jgi:hypothetical protein